MRVPSSDASPRPLHALVLNAGIMAAPCTPAGVHGLEPHMAVNHLGHVALAKQLLPGVRAAAAGEHAYGRVVSVSSLACALNGLRERLEGACARVRFRARSNATAIATASYSCARALSRSRAPAHLPDPPRRWVAMQLVTFAARPSWILSVVAGWVRREAAAF